MSLLTPAGIQLLYENLDTLEKTLNFLGYIPKVGRVSGKWGRQTLATAQVVSGVAIAVFAMFFNAKKGLTSFYQAVAFTMIQHGVLNRIRAHFEMEISVPFLKLLPIDYLFGRVFSYPISNWI